MSDPRHHRWSRDTRAGDNGNTHEVFPFSMIFALIALNLANSWPETRLRIEVRIGVRKEDCRLLSLATAVYLLTTQGLYGPIAPQH